PFMATENILMACVKRGGDRQELHELIRKHAQDAAARVKNDGTDNDLLDRLAADPAIGMTRQEIDEVLDIREFVGRAPQQVDEFLDEEIGPVLERHKDKLGASSDVRV
ncbi:MAG: adenylosuccinate lyase, partial [Candidatus Hydrogenedentes bacterium]|nr:adenylosuccinate lyase [Candidatus Hydrogenedentota bacterium]